MTSSEQNRSRRALLGQAAVLGAAATAALPARPAAAAAPVPTATVPTITALRQSDLDASAILVLGYHAEGGPGGGVFRLDATDRDSADDGGLTVVSRNGNRYKRVTFGQALDAAWWGAFGDDGTHRLAESFGDLKAAQQVFPHAQGLDDEQDWAALQAAFTAASSSSGSPHPVAIPAGTFVMNRPLIVPPVSNLQIIGAGGGSEGTADRRAVTRLRWTGADGAILVFGDGKTATKGVLLRDLLLDGNGRANGIEMELCQGYRFERVTIDDTETAWQVGASCFSCHWSDCEVNEVRAIGIDLTALDHAASITSCVFRNGPDKSKTPQACIRIGSAAGHCSTVTISGCNFDFHRTVSFIEASRVWSLAVVGCYFEARDSRFRNAIVLGKSDDPALQVFGAVVHGCRITVPKTVDGVDAIACQRVRGLHVAGNYFAGWRAALAIDHQNCSNIGWNANHCAGRITEQPGPALFILADGALEARSDQTPAAKLGRSSPGELVRLLQNGARRGAIIAADGAFGVGSFAGFQWAQFAGGGSADVLPGTVVETVDELCVWPSEANHLPKVKVSDTAGSPTVYGVFMRWDESSKTDAVIVGLGAWLVRLAEGQPRTRGALLESAGNGCARVQASPIVTASTLGKITSGTVIETFPDGSVLVPCTLQCG